MPAWIVSLEKEHWLKQSIFNSIQLSAGSIQKIREVQNTADTINGSEYVAAAQIASMDLGKGTAEISVLIEPDLFYKVLSEKTGLEISNESALLESIFKLSDMQKEYDKIAQAYEQVLDSNYGIVMPTMEELSLEEPQIIKQNGKYGIRLRASAPSIHMMKIMTTTEVTPIVGSEQQSQELVSYLLKEFEEDPQKIWESNIFGKSVHELVNEGLHNKLYRMPQEARGKVKETIEKIINDGCNGLICIII
jgi:stage IV sporulation protein A